MNYVKPGTPCCQASEFIAGGIGSHKSAGKPVRMIEGERMFVYSRERNRSNLRGTAMINTPISVFARFAGATTPSDEIRVVEEAREDYEAAHDYWKQLREAIEEGIRTGNLEKAVDKAIRTASSRKSALYEDVGHRFLEWVRKNDVSFVGKLPAKKWEIGGLTVQVNPELVSEIGGARVVTKLWFREEKLNYRCRSVFLSLMNQTYGRDRGPYGVLEVRSGKLRLKGTDIKRVDAYLASKAAAFVTLWNYLDQSAASNI